MIAGYLLALEASTGESSVALLADGAVIAERHMPARRANGERTEGLVPAIVDVLHAVHAESRDLRAVACSAGPGGFTSLRTAASVAKGICFALGIPLYAIPSLELLTMSEPRADGVYAVTLDAGRGEWYASIVRIETGVLRSAEPVRLLGRDELEHFAHAHDAVVIGPAVTPESFPRAAAAAQLLSRIEAAGPVALDQWEPAYGRLAEAQVKWEAAHGRPLDA